jgi:hypothetical protein
MTQHPFQKTFEPKMKLSRLKMGDATSSMVHLGVILQNMACRWRCWRAASGRWWRSSPPSPRRTIKSLSRSHHARLQSCTAEWSTGGTSEIGCFLSTQAARFPAPYGMEMPTDRGTVVRGQCHGPRSPVGPWSVGNPPRGG